MRKPLLLLSLLSGLSLLACAGNEQEAKGPAERAGEKIDDTAKDAKDEAEKAGERTGDAIDDAGDKARERNEDKK